MNVEDPSLFPELFVVYWNQRDAVSLSNLFSEEAEFVNVVGLWWHTREEIFRAHDYGLKVIFKDSDLKLLKKKVQFLSEDVALIHARMKLSGQTSVGEVNQPETRRNMFSFVAKRYDSSWLLVSAHNTDIIPGKETNIIEDGKLKSVDYRK